MDRTVRTLGDGIDNAVTVHETSMANLNQATGIKVNRNKTYNMLKSLRPIEGRKLYTLVPRYKPEKKKVTKYLLDKPKEPRFVPYEPFKAAVTPILPNKQPKIVEQRMSKNNIGIQKLAHQLSEMRKAEMEKLETVEDSGGAEKMKEQWDKERESYEIDIKNLRETNAHLENQLKFQAQVNSELKTLLVAAVGEDLETRVQHLTEDKLALARALLNSANHLTSHQERTEWLSGQCEVWKSKFLASSLMVEELAKWKSALTNRINELQEVLKVLLDERAKVSSNGSKTFINLKAVTKAVSDSPHDVGLKYGNVLEISSLSQELSQIIKYALKVNVDENLQSMLEKVTPTAAERKAEKLLQNPVTITDKQDILCSAVMGAATNLGRAGASQDICIHNCCAHCKGDMQNI